MRKNCSETASEINIRNQIFANQHSLPKNTTSSANITGALAHKPFIAKGYEPLLTFRIRNLRFFVKEQK